MAYRFQVNETICINCGICMDLCPVRCLDMSRPSGDGEIGIASERLTPIPGANGVRAWMMLAPIQVSQCIGCQVCANDVGLIHAVIVTVRFRFSTDDETVTVSMLPLNPTDAPLPLPNAPGWLSAGLSV